MGFTRFVEVGRVVIINYGENVGKLATIIDVVDVKRVLVDAPASADGVVGFRQVIALKRLSLTDILIERLPRGATPKTLTKAWTEQKISDKWNATSWAKKLASKAARKNNNDFDRFKVMIAKKQKSKIIAAKLTELSK